MKMHYIDLKYKGVKIKSSWRHLIRDIFTGIFLLFFFMFLVVSVYKTQEISLSQLKNWNMKEIAILCMLSALLSGFLLSVLAVVLTPLWDYIRNLERLCEMIWSARFYAVNDVISLNMMKAEEARVKKDIAYFPTFYYRKIKSRVEITVRLDGSIHHQNGTFKKLTAVFEELYDLSVVDMCERNSYFTYALLENVEANRLNLEDVIPDGYTIPLMKGMSWNVAKPPHALINGATGGGKSVFINILIRAFLYMGADIRIADPKNSSLVDYERILPNVSSSNEVIMEILRDTVDEMMQRYQDMKEHPEYISGQDFTNYKMKPVVVIVDEYTALIGGLDKKGKEEFNAYLSQLVLKGREAGVFIVLATQRPDAKYLDGGIRDQFGLRVALGKMTTQGYKMTFGDTTQELRNKGKQGRGYIFIDGHPFIQEFYAPLMPEKYRFIEEARKLLGMSDYAFRAKRRKASRNDNGQENEPKGELKVREIIYEGGKDSERSE